MAGWIPAEEAPGVVVIDEARLAHIFRQAEGRLTHDTPGNRRILEDVANDPASVVGTDRFGNAWAARQNFGGSQVWVQIRGDRITNGGIIPTAVSADSLHPSPYPLPQGEGGLTGVPLPCGRG